MFSNSFTGQILQRYGNISKEKPKGLFEFVHELTQAFEAPEDFNPAIFLAFPTSLITDYIRKTHRHYLFKRLPEMEQSIQLLLQDYDEGHPLLETLHSAFLDYKTQLSLHICEEENHLLPYVEFLIDADNYGFTAQEYFYQTTRYSLREFEEDHHDDHETGLRNIRKSILSYNPPATNSSPHRILIEQLDNFDRDLSVHGMIEDKVLLPRMMEVERRLNELFRSQTALN